MGERIQIYNEKAEAVEGEDPFKVHGWRLTREATTEPMEASGGCPQLV